MSSTAPPSRATVSSRWPVIKGFVDPPGIPADPPLEEAEEYPRGVSAASSRDRTATVIGGGMGPSIRNPVRYRCRVIRAEGGRPGLQRSGSWVLHRDPGRGRRHLPRGANEADPRRGPQDDGGPEAEAVITPLRASPSTETLCMESAFISRYWAAGILRAAGIWIETSCPSRRRR